MKKVILLFLVVAGLNAGSFICEDSIERIKKYNTLFTFAHEEDNVNQMFFTNDRRLAYVGKAIANCSSKKYSLEALRNLRKSYLGIKDALNDLYGK